MLHQKRGTGADFDRSGDTQGQHGNPQEAQDELMNLMTIMYIAIQETLNDPEDMASTYGKLRMSFLLFCAVQDTNRFPSRPSAVVGRLHDDSNCETTMG